MHQIKHGKALILQVFSSISMPKSIQLNENGFNSPEKDTYFKDFTLFLMVKNIRMSEEAAN